MRIVHIITRFIRGGADENTMLSCNGQAMLGHEVHLVIGDHHPDMVAALDPRVSVHHMPSLRRAPTPRDLVCLLKLTRLLRRLAPDVVHTHESKAGILGRFAARRAGVKRIVHGVHILPFIGVSRPVAAFYLRLERLAARSTHAYVSVSEEMRSLCLANKLGAKAIHAVVPSGMDLRRFREAVPLPRDEILPGMTIPTGVPLALLASTLEPRKRVDALVRALAETGRGRPWALIVAGDGNGRAALERLIAELGLQDRVFLLGFRTDLPRLLATCDLLVHAAANEGLPRVVVQAVLAGVPVVSTALPGIEAVVGDGVNGLLSPVDSIPALAENLFRLAGDRALRERMRVAARARDLSAWDSSEMVARIEAVYAAIPVSGKG